MELFLAKDCARRNYQMSNHRQQENKHKLIFKKEQKKPEEPPLERKDVRDTIVQLNYTQLYQPNNLT